MASRFLSAIWRALVQPKQLSLDEEARRLETCERCPFFDPTYRKCTGCDCFVDLKTSIGSEKCPKGYW